MRKYTIYLDLDGVLADLESAAVQRLKKLAASLGKIEENDWKKLTWYGYKVYDEKNLDCYSSPFNLFRMPKERIDELLSHDFWVNLPLMPNVKEIFSLLNSKEYIEQIYILSNHSGLANAASGKTEWCRKNLKCFESEKFSVDNNVILCKNKFLLANENAILIDDMSYNVNKFMIAGGISHFYTSFERLKSFFDILEFVDLGRKP